MYYFFLNTVYVEVHNVKIHHAYNFLSCCVTL